MSQKPGRTRGAGTAVMIAALLTPAGAWGHSEPPPPPPPPPVPLPQVSVRELVPLRWSWLHWWEANRAAYLRPATQSGGEQEAADEAVRSRAEAALAAALGDPDGGVRAAAALALGSIGGPEQAAALRDRVERDPDPAVVHRATVALGLLDAPDTVPFLLGHEHPTAFLRATAVLMLGSLSDLDGGTLRRLAGLMDGDALTVNAVTETLIVPRPAGSGPGQRVGGWDADDLRQRLGRARSPWVAARVLHAMGEGDARADGQAPPPDAAARPGVGDARTDALLLDAAVAGPGLQASAAWKFLETLAGEKARQLSRIEGVQVDARARKTAVDGWWTLHERLVAQAPEPERPPALFGLPPAAATGEIGSRDGLVKGLERIYRSRLQAAAVAALSRRNPEGTEAALLEVLNRGDEDDAVPRAHAAIGLGFSGGPAGLARLLEIVEGTAGRDDRVGDHVAREDPLRGFATLALGLYARPVPGEQGAADRPGFDKAVDAMLRRLGDARETDEVRAAAAVGLGVAGRTLALPPLVRASAALGADDAPLPGYVLLARALLGEADLVEPVDTLLAAAPARDETVDLLQRRAAVLALGLTGQRAAIPLLAEAWNQPFFVNREVLRSMALLGARGLGTTLIERLEGSDNRFERAYMAEALGELFADGAEGRGGLQARFLQWREFTMKDGMLEDARLLCNPFLYRHLIPQFESPWY